MGNPVKTEHNGAKNGGGYWGKRNFAKWISNRKRRVDQRRQEQEWKNTIER